MKEIIFLNFGNSSNFISSHFWNLNDEMFKKEDKFNIDNSVIYNDYYHPRNIIFDFSENVRPYFALNEKLNNKQIKEIEEDFKFKNQQFQVNTFKTEYKTNAELNDDQSNYDDVDEYNEEKEIEDENEINNYSKTNNKFFDLINLNEQILSDKKLKNADNILNLPEDKIFEYLDFEHSIRNWNDFLQPRFNKRTLNEIRTSSIDTSARGSYLKGYDFLNSEKNEYLEPFDNNFRKFLEDCDRLEMLHINVDFNSGWGGISNSLMETLSESIPKTMKMIYGIDNHSSFYRKDDSFNEEKFLNYLWYFSDLNSLSAETIFMPIYKQQNPGFVRQTFKYDFDFSINPNDPIYEFYFTSLVGLNMQNLYIPQRSKYFNSSAVIMNLIHNSGVNFIESETNFALENLNFYPNFNHLVKNNGILFSFARSFRNKFFSWEKIYENSWRLNKFNSTIIHGYKDSNFFLGNKIEGFLIKNSSINFTCLDKFDLPICFPRKIYPDPKSQSESIFMKDISIMSTYRPFVEYPLKYLEPFTDFIKEFDFDIRKYINCNFDSSRYYEYREKIEEYHSIIESYEHFNDSYNLGIYRNEDLEEDDV